MKNNIQKTEFKQLLIGKKLIKKNSILLEAGKAIRIFNKKSNQLLMRELANHFLEFKNYKKIIDITDYGKYYIVRILKKYFTFSLFKTIYKLL